MSEIGLWDIRRALNGARQTLAAADTAASESAGLAVGRMRHVDTDVCAALKRELRDFNLTTMRWKP